VLMDINMPEVNGIEGLKLIKTKYPEVRVLMQTAYDDSDKIFTSIKNGASGYILKNDKPQRILQAIEEVYEGGAVMNPAIAQKVLDYFKPNEKKSPLSPKENEVVALLAEGLSYKMVADKLAVSYSTINTHTKRIYEKLHISSLGEAIAWYYKNQY
jgi:DNA-binding NarL/FixJ family response regulator